VLANVVVCAYLAGLLVALLLNAWFLHLGTKRSGAAEPSFGKALGIHLFGTFIAVTVAIVSSQMAPDFAWMALAGSLVGLVAQWAVIAKIFQLTMGKAIQAWLWTLIPTSVVGALLLLVVRPYVIEAYAAPTNSMAPTILGRHLIEPCPVCGHPAYCTPWTNDAEQRGVESLVICSRERRSRKVVIRSSKVYSRDRFLVAKYLRPQRWDLLVFRYPEEPSVLFIKRLVGLPGETVIIKDGSIWINDQKQELPAAIQGTEYLDTLDENWGQQTWGNSERPAHLGDGEYFVLGDFSAAAKDSRFWVEGAPGHPPYAVPESHIIGVATHIYWPPSRWGRLR
jgi:signal peptidase I